MAKKLNEVNETKLLLVPRKKQYCKYTMQTYFIIFIIILNHLPFQDNYNEFNMYHNIP